MMKQPWSLRVLGLLLLLLRLGWAEKRPFDIILTPTDELIHYTSGYIRAPGHIDLSGLVFTAVSEAFVPSDDGIIGTGDDRALDGGIETDATAVDVAVFPLPPGCARKGSCDWTLLGVGAKASDQTKRWCCSTPEVQAGICDLSQHGRLIINATAFNGKHRFINIPTDGKVTKQIKYGDIEETQSGEYIVVISNCNTQGREIKVTGEAVWQSKHGYLPGELFGFMYFYLALTVAYTALLLWYALLMHINQESRIPIEKWIFLTIILGTLEMFFRTGDYFVWNQDGYRMDLAFYIAVLVGAIKRGVSRCLIVMVSLGWGVVRESLGSSMRTIVVLGAVYIAVSATRDLMIELAIADIETLSYNTEVEMFDVLTILTFIIAAIDVIFVLWILDGLNGTMEYLQNMNQMRKLNRYLRLRCIFLFSILFATVWVVFSLVNTYDEDGIVMEEHEWIVEAATEVNYFYVLVGVAILWRPNPSAKEYAYVMELPTLDGEAGENELELAGAVPSAMDEDDDEEPSGKNRYHDEEHDDRFQIDDAEAT